MKIIKSIAIAAVLTLGVFVAMSFINKSNINKNKTNNQGFAVVELFTSEGCSSCPPADELVAKIQSESKDVPVYILAFHVDYWNRLGWKDVFSSAEYSNRQRDYANYLNLQSVYTPQIVVNGKTEFVGSQEGTLRSAIKSGLQKNANVQLNISYTKPVNNSGEIKYSVNGNSTNSVLLLAFVQKKATTKVERGENGGQTLSHVQIVRKLQTINLNDKAGKSMVNYPAGFDTTTWEIIGLVQNTNNGEIISATKASQNSENNAVVKL
jgi:hypothetical protein